MRTPLVYEVNTRCWLRELSARARRPITLDQVPVAELSRWHNLGFTHVWLMGVWTCGPRSRAVAQRDSNLRAAAAALLPDAEEADVVGSPFAISAYEVPAGLGGSAGLKAFREKLHAHDLRLLLDFVPNHIGLDHPWVTARPELFVPGTPGSAEAFAVDLPEGRRWLAHGKDPFFPAWTDTVQLDYRRPETHTAMRHLFENLLAVCDGVRCDMAMLLLKDIFARTWAGAPGPASPADGEFWADLIGSTKQVAPDFLFLAEAYWDLETRLQELGFDYTYDKRLYDHLIARNPATVSRHLLSVTARFLAASAHFLENHDEARIAGLLPPAEHRAAALLTFGLPGLRLFHEGQLTGARLRLPVQLGRRPVELADPVIGQLYATLLAALRSTAVGQSSGTLRLAREAWPGNPSWQNLTVVQWQAESGTFDLVVVNLAPHRSQAYVRLGVEGLPQRNWRMTDLLGTEAYVRYGDDLQNQGLYLDVAPHAAHLFHFAPVN